MHILIDKVRSASPRRPDESLSFPVFVLMKDNWNDFSYMTLCTVYVFSSYEAEAELLGDIRIMYRGQEAGPWVFENIDEEPLSRLNSTYCALGASIEFYKNLRELGQSVGSLFLRNIRDAAYSPEIWLSFQSDPCFKASLMRHTGLAIEIRDTVAKLFDIRRRRRNSFRYTVQLPGAKNEHSVLFNFRATPPLSRRLMLLVGPNGSGKTQLLAKLAIALSGITSEEGVEEKEGIALEKREHSGLVDPVPSFYSVIAVSFNAFDEFEIPDSASGAKFRYTYCGIRLKDGGLCSARDLIDRIQSAIDNMDDHQRSIFTKTIGHVLGTNETEDLFEFGGRDHYEKLSAGQRIVLNILTHLIANLRDQSLVLFDEPETHLHPSLMTTLITELFRLLKVFNSFAIVATHSPMIAQQVVSQSVRVFARIEDDFAEVTTPEFECFGESLSALSNRLFESREDKRDYIYLLDKMLKRRNFDPERVEEDFSGRLGSNARIYLWSAAREKKD